MKVVDLNFIENATKNSVWQKDFKVQKGCFMCIRSVFFCNVNLEGSLVWTKIFRIEKNYLQPSWKHCLGKYEVRIQDFDAELYFRIRFKSFKTMKESNCFDV